MMKKYISMILITLAVAGSSCKKNYLDLTDNPNVPSVASPNLLLSGALKTTAGIVNNARNSSDNGQYVMYAAWTGYLSQSTSFQPFVNIEQYQFQTSDFQNVWTDNYTNLSNYHALEQANAGPNYQAIAEIMSVYDWQALVDNYNNVPYTTALQGAGNLNPSYQTGQSIYLDLMKRLDAAIVLIQKATSSDANPGGADIMFSGNMSNWLLFANTLKLRLCLRESSNSAISADFATLKTAVQATESLGYLNGSIAATVNPGYINTDANGGQQSPLWLYYGFTQGGGQQPGRQQYQANSFAANYYASHNDPRLIEVYSASGTTGVAGATSLSAGTNVNVQNGVAIVSTVFGTSQPPVAVINGATVNNVDPSLIGPGLLVSAAQNAVVMSSAEALFLQAEAAARNIINGTASTLYNQGITASFEFDQVPDADAAAATYYSQASVAYPTDGSLSNQINAIIMQKWAALDVFGAFEAFNEERRTGIPNVPTSTYTGANAPNQVTRILYPFIEYQTNATNVGAEGTINKFTSKIFWAQ